MGILVVDDSEESRSIFKAVLEDAGYKEVLLQNWLLPHSPSWPSMQLCLRSPRQSILFCLTLSCRRLTASRPAKSFAAIRC